jgi:hypothetical protein
MLINRCKYNALPLWIVLICIVLFDLLQLLSSPNNQLGDKQNTTPLVFSEARRVHDGKLLEPNTLSLNGPLIYKIKVSKWQPLSLEYLCLRLLPQTLPNLGHKRASLRNKKCSILLYPKHYFW